MVWFFNLARKRLLNPFALSQRASELVANFGIVINYVTIQTIEKTKPEANELGRKSILITGANIGKIIRSMPSVIETGNAKSDLDLTNSLQR